MLEETLTAGALVTLFVEAAKWVARKFNRELSFSPLFYLVSVPVLNVFMPFLLVWLGVFTDDPILSMEFPEVLKFAFRVALATLITFVGYNDGLKPLKSYSQFYSETHE
jgi:hypothetical protein